MTRRFGMVAVMLVSCGGAPVGATSTTSAVVVPHAAQRLLVDSAACWLGGVWGDVHAETPAERERTSQQRCDAVIVSVFRKHDDSRYLQLRAYDPATLAEVRNAIGRAARRDPDDARDAGVLERMFTALAAADQETTLARRSAHRILRDLDREPENLAADETAALPQLQSFSGFSDLYRMDAGDLGAEKHALALLVLIDRLRIAETLPVHMKPYVVVLPMREVFSAPIPPLPYDASKPLYHGEWLVYLEDAARQARHPVDGTQPQQVRHEQAMAGIFAGIADQLSADASALGENHPLSATVTLTIRALDQSRQRVASR